MRGARFLGISLLAFCLQTKASGPKVEAVFFSPTEPVGFLNGLNLTKVAGGYYLAGAVSFPPGGPYPFQIKASLLDKGELEADGKVTHTLTSGKNPGSTCRLPYKINLRPTDDGGYEVMDTVPGTVPLDSELLVALNGKFEPFERFVDSTLYAYSPDEKEDIVVDIPARNYTSEKPASLPLEISQDKKIAFVYVELTIKAPNKVNYNGNFVHCPSPRIDSISLTSPAGKTQTLDSGSSLFYAPSLDIHIVPRRFGRSEVEPPPSDPYTTINRTWGRTNPGKCGFDKCHCGAAAQELFKEPTKGTWKLNVHLTDGQHAPPVTGWTATVSGKLKIVPLKDIQLDQAKNK